MKKQTVFILIFALTIFTVLIFSQIPKKAIKEISSVEQKQIGIISTNDKQGLMFTNLEYKFTLAFPSGWVVWDESYKSGYIQVFNYPQELASSKGGFTGSEGSNKIETYITDSDIYTKSSEYPEKEILSKKIVIGLNTITKTQVELQGGEEFISYYVKIPDENKFVNIVIYGDERNFSVLERILETLVWNK